MCHSLKRSFWQVSHNVDISEIFLTPDGNNYYPKKTSRCRTIQRIDSKQP